MATYIYQTFTGVNDTDKSGNPPGTTRILEQFDEEQEKFSQEISNENSLETQKRIDFEHQKKVDFEEQKRSSKLRIKNRSKQTGDNLTIEDSSSEDNCPELGEQSDLQEQKSCAKNLGNLDCEISGLRTD